MMTKEELEKHRAAADTAKADLEAAQTKQAEAQAEAERVAAERAGLPLDEKKIAAHLDREKAVALKLEIATRLVAQAETALAESGAALGGAEWQFQHDELNARGEALAKTLRSDYTHHCAAIVKILVELKRFDDDAWSFRSRFMHSPHKGDSTLQYPASLVGMRDFNQAFIPGLDGGQLWPLNKESLAAIKKSLAESLDRSIG
ncbi:hypothetical protein [Methyloferula stellata]|uniref:hypothetical protein n=1 Tax=Methyloferula stellata TaxID=876270 RepID=UPI00036C1DD6|nr:hypothetical protein [Methyloferula stellata]